LKDGDTRGADAANATSLATSCGAYRGGVGDGIGAA